MLNNEKASLIGTGRKNGLVIDFSHSGLSFVPIYSNNIDSKNALYFDISGFDLINNIKR